MRISDWSSDVCSSDLKPHSAILQNSRATSLLLARRAGAYLSSHRLPPLPTAGRWRYRMTKLPILAALAAAFLAQPAIGRAHVCTPVTNAHLVCRLLLENTKPNLHHNLVTPNLNNTTTT